MNYILDISVRLRRSVHPFDPQDVFPRLHGYPARERVRAHPGGCDERRGIGPRGRTNQRHKATFRLTVALRSVAQLARLLRRIETVRGVIAVSRDGTRAR